MTGTYFLRILTHSGAILPGAKITRLQKQTAVFRAACHTCFTSSAQIQASKTLIYCFQKEGHKSALQGNAQHPIMEVKVTRQKRKTRRSHLHVKQTTVELKGIKNEKSSFWLISTVIHATL